MSHHCDERCVCPVDGEPLLYSRLLDEHACAHPECVNAHGMDGVMTALVEDLFGTDEARHLARFIRKDP